MSKYLSNIANSITPYVPGEQPKNMQYIKLNTNENPYPPSPKVIDALKQSIDEKLRLYPDPTCDSLINTIANYYNVNNNQVFVGNGSDELLAFSYLAFFNEGENVAYADITYSFYEVYTNFFRLKPVLIPLDKDYNLVKEDYYQKNCGIILANPNAPTGKAISLDSIKYILDNNTEHVVIVDEAYVDFGAETAVALINDYPNLLVIKTLSKSRSLAGLRIGYALGNKELITGLNNVKNSINSYTLDRLALIAAEEAFRDDDYLKETAAKIISTRNSITEKLRLLGYNVLDSKANFIFAGHNNIPAVKLQQILRENGILVRHFKIPRIDNYLRISIGTDKEMEALYLILKSLVKN